MALVYNPTPYKVQVKALGSYFDFAPKQKKTMNDNIAHFITTSKRESGLVELPEVCIDAPESDEAQAALVSQTRQGMLNMLTHYKSIVTNLTVSLRRDMEKANFKSPVESEASDGERYAMKVVKELSDILNAESAVKEEETKQLLAALADIK